MDGKKLGQKLKETTEFSGKNGGISDHKLYQNIKTIESQLNDLRQSKCCEDTIKVNKQLNEEIRSIAEELKQKMRTL
jgi:hypothetical protein